MNLFQSLILGVIQGLTEFLPVSSTAHLILIPWLFNWSFDTEAAFVFDVLLQLGTLLAVIVYFAKDLTQIIRLMIKDLMARTPFASAESRLGWLIIAATIPAAIMGLLFKKYFEALHQQPVIVATILLAAALLIFFVEYIGKRERKIDSLTWVDALIIGASQALALFPGVSRSAATMSGGLLRGLERKDAARFSFLMSIPIMLAAGAVAIKDLIAIPNFTTHLPSLALGFVAAAVVGFASIHWLLGFLAKRSMLVFAWYRVGFGLLCLVIGFLMK
jgi:undecaprenyl-diphosphatase